jgi:hypothetical protein
LISPINNFLIFWELATQTTPHAFEGLGVAHTLPEGIPSSQLGVLTSST